MAIRSIGGGGSVGETGGEDAILHTVQQGETMEGIAGQHGITKEELLKSNPHIKDASQIQAGMALQIPEKNRSQPSSALSKDSFESVPDKSALDKMMDGPHYHVDTVATHEPSHFDKFNEGDTNDVSWDRSDKIAPGKAQSWGDPHINDGSPEMAPGRARSWGDPHVKTESDKNIPVSSDDKLKDE